jgi:hypothetical protein
MRAGDHMRRKRSTGGIPLDLLGHGTYARFVHPCGPSQALERRNHGRVVIPVVPEGDSMLVQALDEPGLGLGVPEHQTVHVAVAYVGFCVGHAVEVVELRGHVGRDECIGGGHALEDSVSGDLGLNGVIGVQEHP